MSALLQAELLKLRTTRTFFALTGSALVLSLIVLVLNTLLVDNFSEEDVRATFSGDFTGIFILLLGAMGMAGEWRHKTITSTVLAAPNRLKLIAAKAISYAIAGVVVSFIVTASLMLVGSIILSSRGETTLDAATLVDIMWRNLVVAAYLGAIGVAVGAILRNQVAAIIGLILFPLVVELTLFGLVPDVARFSPINGVTSGLSNINTDQGSDLDFLDPGVAALVMCGWLSVLFAAGALLLKRRDLT
jgi:ABC-type transport system involved in multi-copper enzyme maturation permease subunit